MKLNIFFILISFAFFGCSSNAQNATKAKEKAVTQEKVEDVKKVVKEKVEETTKTEVTTDKMQEETFIVYGNCSMCERRIEAFAKQLEGVKVADWDMLTDKIVVSFDPKLVSLDDIKQKIADAGYDSDTHRAKDENYKMLPGSCKYDRPE